MTQRPPAGDGYGRLVHRSGYTDFVRSRERPTARRDDLLRRAIDSWIAKRGSGFVSIAAQVGADDMHRETRDRISDLGQDDAPIFPGGSSTGDHKRN